MCRQDRAHAAVPSQDKPATFTSRTWGAPPVVLNTCLAPISTASNSHFVPLASTYIQNSKNFWVTLKQTVDHSMDLAYGPSDRRGCHPEPTVYGATPWVTQKLLNSCSKPIPPTFLLLIKRSWHLLFKTTTKTFDWKAWQFGQMFLWKLFLNMVFRRSL